MVPAFAGSIFESRGPLEGQVEILKSQRFKGTKVKIGFGVEEDSRILRKVRDAWPDGMLVADANGAYDRNTALSACRAFEEFGLAWFEEPVPSDDWDGYRSLRGNTQTKVGAGETWFVDDFEGEERLVDVLEPSVSRCGGIGVEAEVGRRAREHGLGFSPMTGMNSALSLAASLHVAAITATVGVEANPFPNPLVDRLLVEPLHRAGGNFEVPEAPGLGVEVDERFLAASSNRA
jgi:D-galactarolactone cycloisomerase